MLFDRKLETAGKTIFVHFGFSSLEEEHDFCNSLVTSQNTLYTILMVCRQLLPPKYCCKNLKKTIHFLTSQNSISCNEYVLLFESIIHSITVFVIDRPLPVYFPTSCPGCNGKNTILLTSTDYIISIISSKGLLGSVKVFDVIMQ